jgi:hypothetical protein
MKNNSFFDLTIATISDASQVPGGVDIVNLTSVEPEFGYVRPLKVAWRAYIASYPDLFQFIKADRLKKSLKKWFKEYPQEGISIEYIRDLSATQYEMWLAKYTGLLLQKDRPNLKLTQEWYQEKKGKNKELRAVFLYQDGAFIGGNICTIEADRLSVGYGVVEKREGTSYNMGAFVDFATLLFARELGKGIVSFGQDTNLYGFHLSLGLLSYKCRFGLTAEPVLKNGLVTTKFVHFEHLKDTIAFVSITDSKTTITVLYTGEEPRTAEFQARGIDEVVLINRNEL